MTNEQLLQVICLELDNLSDDQEIRELQILQLQNIISLQMSLTEVQKHETTHRRTQKKDIGSSQG